MINVNTKITILKWNHIDNGNKTKWKHHKMMANKRIKQRKKKKKMEKTIKIRVIRATTKASDLSDKTLNMIKYEWQASQYANAYSRTWWRERLPQIEPNFIEYWNIILLFHFATRQRLIRPYEIHMFLFRFSYMKREKRNWTKTKDTTTIEAIAATASSNNNIIRCHQQQMTIVNKRLPIKFATHIIWSMRLKSKKTERINSSNMMMYILMFSTHFDNIIHISKCGILYIYLGYYLLI